MESVGLSGQRLMDLLLLHVTVKVSAFNGTMHFYRAINQTLKPNMTKRGTWWVFIMRKSGLRCVWWFGRVSTSPLGGLLCFLSADDWWTLTGFVFGSWWLVRLDVIKHEAVILGVWYVKSRSFRMKEALEVFTAAGTHSRTWQLKWHQWPNVSVEKHSWLQRLYWVLTDGKYKVLNGCLYWIKQGDVVYFTKTQLCFFFNMHFIMHFITIVSISDL